MEKKWSERRRTGREEDKLAVEVMNVGKEEGEVMSEEDRR